MKKVKISKAVSDRLDAADSKVFEHLIEHIYRLEHHAGMSTTDIKKHLRELVNEAIDAVEGTVLPVLKVEGTK